MPVVETAFKVIAGALLLAYLLYVGFGTEEDAEATGQGQGHTSPHYQITADAKRRLLAVTESSSTGGLRHRSGDSAASGSLRGCCVCRDAEVEMLFNKCGHVCMCERCVVMAAGGADASEDTDVVLRCPQCRVSGTLRRVYCA